MPPEEFNVVVKASRTEIVEFIVPVTANNRTEAEAVGMSEGRRWLRQGAKVPLASHSNTPWHVIDAVPVVKADGSPHPG